VRECSTDRAGLEDVDVKAIRRDFPILHRQVGGRPLIYLDSAATTHKPRQVLDTLERFYSHYNANIHRSPHTLGQEASELYEDARRNCARFIGARSSTEIIFVRNATEGINLVAYALSQAASGQLHLRAGDEIVATIAEHHSNLVPWQQLARRSGATLKVAGVTDDGCLDMAEMRAAITSRTRLVCCTHVSNVLGTVNPVREIGRMARDVGALFLVDGAQSVPHLPVDVADIGCDFLAFSGHKMLAPMGIGVLYGRRELLEQMAPFQHGGGMIDDVCLDGATWNSVPWKFEAGTPNIGGAVALAGATDRRTGERLPGAIDYLGMLGMGRVARHEQVLTRHALEGLQTIEPLTIYGHCDLERRTGVVTFSVPGNDSHIVARMLDEVGIAVRSGGHCGYPLARRMGVEGTVRASFYIYNSIDEVDAFLEALDDIIRHKLI
jgi:cysteine desulfurase/selenocysteine lyase